MHTYSSTVRLKDLRGSNQKPQVVAAVAAVLRHPAVLLITFTPTYLNGLCQLIVVNPIRRLQPSYLVKSATDFEILRFV